MPFPDASFDHVCANYCVLHLGEPDRFFAEAARVLRPGGRLSFSVWEAPPATEAFSLVLGAVAVAGNPSVPLPPGPPFFQFSDPTVARAALEAAGFTDVASRTVEQRWENVKDPEDLMKVFLEGTACTRALLEGQSSAELAAIRQELSTRFFEKCADLGPGPGRTRALRMPAAVSSGRKAK